MTPQALPSAADQLNKSCFCITLDRDALYATIDREARDPTFSSRYLLPRANLFSNVAVFLTMRELDRMTAVIQMIEAAAKLPAFQDAVLTWAPAIARFDPGPRGVLMGYDFHLGASGPKLIEVNTNAGGAFLNTLLIAAQRACCPEVEQALKLPLASVFDAKLIEMFQAEWMLQRGAEPLRRVAIVDDDPESQYLYPEFLLARETFIRHGIDAVVANAAELRFAGGRLWVGEAPIDLIYNRLVDFSLEHPEHAQLRDGYLAGAVVLTSNPSNHALLADKRNLTLLSDRSALLGVGLPPELADQSMHIPRTVQVLPDNVSALWQARRSFFFKPATGHGAKAVYRGDKLTRSVWQHIAAGGYVAQEFAPPPERIIKLDGTQEARKMDIRLFTYDGRVLLAAARLYQGQTTNFRTQGGGFAPVLFF